MHVTDRGVDHDRFSAPVKPGPESVRRQAGKRLDCAKCGLMAVGHPGVMTMPGSNDRVRVEFQLDHDDDGWPPATTERLWAVPLGEGLVRIDNIPWFVRNIAFGDIVQTRTDPDGGLWAAERIQWSGHCTICVVP